MAMQRPISYNLAGIGDDIRIQFQSRRKILYGALLVVCAGLLIGGYALYRNEQERHRNLRARISNLQAENDKLKSTVASSSDGLGELKKGVQTVITDFDALNASIKDLQSKIDRFEENELFWEDADIQGVMKGIQLRAEGTASKLSAFNTELERQAKRSYEIKTATKVTATIRQESEEAKEQTVYVTDTGKKYHRGSCRYLSRSKNAMKEKAAIAAGYGACKVCRP